MNFFSCVGRWSIWRKQRTETYPTRKGHLPFGSLTRMWYGTPPQQRFSLLCLGVRCLIIFRLEPLFFRRRKNILAVSSLQLTKLSNVDISRKNISSVEWPSEFHLTIIVLSKSWDHGFKVIEKVYWPTLDVCRNLMAKQDMSELGLSGVKELDSTEYIRIKSSIQQWRGTKLFCVQRRKRNVCISFSAHVCW